MNGAILQYFDRAAWAVHNATNAALPPNSKSHLTAMAVHACQSLRESLEQWADDENQPDSTLKAAIKVLPHVQLIESVRNMDLHGWPLPICDPKAHMVAMVSKPDRPIELSASHGVGVALQMDGVTPRIHRMPKDLKHGTVTFGAAVSYGCDLERLVVHDFSTGKDYLLLEVLQSFLRQCHAMFNDGNTGRSTPLEQSGNAPESE